MIKRWKINHNVILLVTLLFFAAVYTTQVVVNHYFFRSYAMDYGFYNQAMWDFAHFRTNANTVIEPILSNFFQIHTGFTLVWLVPVYWILEPVFGSYTLLIIQNLFIILGGYATYLLIKRKTGNFIIALLAFIHFNLIWGHYSALAADYIDTTVASSMVPAFLLFFDRKKYIPASLTFLFVITCKENMPIWFIFISLMLLIVYREKQMRFAALGFGIFSILYLIFLFKVLIPYYEDPALPYWGFAYSALGKNPQEALLFILSHPWKSFMLLFENHLNDPSFNGIKAEFYKVFLLSGGLLIIRRPVYILMFIPIIAQKMLNDLFIRWGILGFYSIEVVSVLTLAAFLATISIRISWIKYGLYIFLCLSTLTVTVTKMERRVSFWYDPAKENLLSRSFYECDIPVKEIKKQIRKFVPEESPMVASQNLVPHFATRKKIHMFPYVHEAGYIVILKGSNTYPLDRKTFDAEIQKYRDDKGWKSVLEDNYLLILKKNDLTEK